MWDQSPLEQNIDILNMQNIPNKTNGTLLYNLADKYDLADPFRALYPSKKASHFCPSVIFGKTGLGWIFFVYPQI